jgi:hypothetical protein
MQTFLGLLTAYTFFLGLVSFAGQVRRVVRWLIDNSRWHT